MVLYLCVLIVFSLRRESLKLILVTDPFMRWFCHSWYQSKLEATHEYLKITTTLCWWGSFSLYKDYCSLLWWQANIFVHIPLRNCINEGIKWFLVCSSYFIVYGLILLFMVLVGLLGLAYASFLFMRIILLLMVTCRNLLVKSPLGDVSEKPMMGMIYLFLQVCLSRSFATIAFLLVRTIRTSCIIKSPNP
jgi:hypothetical protein